MAVYTLHISSFLEKQAVVIFIILRKFMYNKTENYLFVKIKFTDLFCTLVVVTFIRGQ